MTMPHETPIELEAIRSRLASARGEPYWRALEELADTEGFQRYVRQRLSLRVPPWGDALTRRRFLALVAASLGLAGLNGCSLQPPEETIVPYVRQPEEIVLGKPLYFASAMTLRSDVMGILVESHEGRPTKIEGNQQHPASLGATDVFAQASVLGLYDPDRSQTVLYRGQIRSWDSALEAIRGAAAAHRAKRGAGLRLLTETVTSPTLAAQIENLLRENPQAKWHQYEPAACDAVHRASQLAFGADVATHCRFDRAEVIVSLDADFVAGGPGHLRYARDFAARRRLLDDAKSSHAAMNRLYMVQSTPTLAGAKADHVWPVLASRVEAIARALAARVDEQFKGLASSGALGVPEQALEAMARDLRGHRGSSLVIAGQEQPDVVHVLAHAMNHALGNVGKTVIYTDPVEARPEDQTASLGELVREMDEGRVETLVILGGNPVFTAPADYRFGERLLATHPNGQAKVPLRIHLGLYEDETSARCDWHLPEAHWLESWSDARAFDGTASIVQPLIAPIYGGKSSHELLVILSGETARPGHDVVRGHWRGVWESQHPAKQTATQPPAAEGQISPAQVQRDDEFVRFWRTALHDGVLAGTAFPAKSVTMKTGWAERLPGASGPRASGPDTVADDALEIVFRPDPGVFDGRFANNGWLQEFPKPLTRLTWGSALLISPAMAKRLGLRAEPSGHGGEHGEATADVVEIRLRGTTLQVPVWPMPGHPDGSATLHFGHGRTMAGSVGNGVGVNAYPLRTSAAPWFDSGVQIRKTGRREKLACVQYHHLMEGRDLVRSGTLAEYQKDPRSIAASRTQHEGKGEGEPPSLYPGFAYEGYKWGMEIDLSACLGCGACVVACQAENNIPVVGKEQVERGREMHWLRIDRYYQGDAANPRTHFQPVPCMQCENAPCELVCPVEATVHSEEGLNDMVYNRCVGTRYCSNNCPYKVRRFNFLPFADFETPALKPLRNPEVTVRSRGVMEKCTYCVQRITAARIEADKQDRKVRDGEVVTACQAACPAQAIVFGDLNDPDSQVSRRKASALDYSLLEELNTRPRTTYLAAVRNPDPEIG
jgi:MoCo/4Fe-4S cofactor protein with predicted Tat translocation signal